MNSIKHAIAKFSQEEDGAQVVEYALIIAVVSIVLVIALGNGTTGLGAQFAALVTRIGNCLTTAACV